MRKCLRVLLTSMESATLLVEARNGEEAILFAKKHFPDIILMDINMSPVNGFEATRKILKENPAARILGLSMHKQSSYAKNMLHLGAKGYITKSAPHQEIMEAIKKVADGGKYIDKILEGSM